MCVKKHIIDLELRLKGSAHLQRMMRIKTPARIVFNVSPHTGDKLVPHLRIHY